MIVVVLGHRLESSQIHERLRARVNAGIRAFNATDASSLFFSGGQTNQHIDRTECGVMGEYAVRQGVDPDRIVLDPFAHDTIGNAYFTRVLCDNLGLDIDELSLVTDDFHAPRAKYAFDQCFGADVAVETTHAVETETDCDDSTCQQKLQRTRAFFESIPAGDIEAIRQRLHTHHDYYDFSGTVHPVSP
ncbi:hypothetical protein C499_18609 [Halogeometricum borinquense DSM 11551]|uniref:Uncharacterized conserved protein n=1 Tax=Halogeometricum borinquense (strain ATCC 700274 / DSM 11551 / JCM 10706 / KCTC 4070 / PR3) TaxID=469382 RepID=E4NNR5_HALBP|nr:YdcF family protein [Halogeometricum borinquense]ADQ67529.1 uncharacterized conserved protein [Halogeometricum borinquense DSM 11551]ELY23791.1 hypothetical protein C499_18609 [Halogeometricum borinquense DSM 11551]